MKHYTPCVVAAGVLLLAGCDRSLTNPFMYELEVIEGYVTAIDLDRPPPFPPRILIEEQPDAPPINPAIHGSKIWFAVWDATVFEREAEDGSMESIRFEDMEVGVRARAWAGQLIADSYPAKTTAARMRVVPHR